MKKSHLRKKSFPKNLINQNLPELDEKSSEKEKKIKHQSL